MKAKKNPTRRSDVGFQGQKFGFVAFNQSAVEQPFIKWHMGASQQYGRLPDETTSHGLFKTPPRCAGATRLIGRARVPAPAGYQPGRLLHFAAAADACASALSLKTCTEVQTLS